jgi:hypothetical protein
VQLEAAIAPLRTEYVSRQALRVHPDEYVGVAADITVHQCHVLGRIDVVAITDDGELAECGGDARFGNPVHQLFRSQPIRYQLRHSDEREPMLAGDLLQLRAPRHGSIGVQNLTDDPGRVQARQPSEVDTRLGLPYALKHAARARAQRKDMTGPPQIGGHGGGIYGDVDRGGPVRR